MQIATLNVSPLIIKDDGDVEKIPVIDSYRIIVSPRTPADYIEIKEGEIVGWSTGYYPSSGPLSFFVDDRSVRHGLSFGHAYFPKGIGFSVPGVFVFSRVNGLENGMGNSNPQEVLKYLQKAHSESLGEPGARSLVGALSGKNIPRVLLGECEVLL